MEIMNRDSLLPLNQTQLGVFHAPKWGQMIPQNFVPLLIEEAENNPNRKARICLHPSPDEITQVTIVALVAPYKDRLHTHPTRPEIMFPLFGKAVLTIYDDRNGAPRYLTLDSNERLPISIETNVVHSLRVVTASFVFIEIGNGPFTNTSTHYI